MTEKTEKNIQSVAIDIGYIKKAVDKLDQRVDGLNRKIDKDIADKNELDSLEDRLRERYDPVRSLVFGLIGTIAMSVLGALIALVIK